MSHFIQKYLFSY